MSRSVRLRTLSLLLMISLLTSILALPTEVAHAINTPWLSVSGRFIKDPAGNNVELRGVSLVDLGVADSRPRNARQLIDMATNEADGWYARVVRLPVYPEAIDETPGWNANPDAYFNNHLNPAIQECVARQIYCIIDWHYISDYTSSAINTSTRNFWSYVAPKYANTPNVIFELFNEPMNPDNWSTWRTTAQPWVDLIRSYAPNNLILIGGPRWSQNLSSAPSQPFTGSNLVYVAHIYPEHGGQSTWDSWFGNAANSVPFFVTEWGWQQGGTTPTSGTQSGYGVPFSNYLESKGLSWTAWVFDQYWQPVMFDLNYNLLSGEAYMGQFTKDLLFQHRNEGLPSGGGPTDTPPGPTFTPTRTNTPGTPVSGNLKVQVMSGGTDNNQQTAFRFRVQNTGATAQSNISARLYFTLDGSNAASNYTLEKYYDQSGVATVSGPTQASGSTYYFTVNYGTTSLPAGGSWEFQTALHLANWGSNFSGTNDFWHTTGTLPAAFTDWPTVPAYVSGSRVWGSEPGGTPVPTSTFTRTPTTGPTNTPTRTPTNGPTNTPTRTPTRTPTGGPTNTPTRTPTNGPSNLKVQVAASGTDNNQQTAFRFRVQNTGSSAQSNISARLYFTLDGSNAASNYTLEKYYDQSGVATVSGPTQASGSTYYFTVNYGTASLAAGATWEFQTALHLVSWGSNYSGTNDFWHTTGTLPSAFTDWTTLPAYVSGSRVWGTEPGGTPVPTNTFTRTPTTGPTNTPTRTPTNGPTNTPTSTPTRTPTGGPTNTPTRTPTNGPSNLKVQVAASGTDNNQQTAFRFRVQNTGSSAVSNVSVRIYFTTDGSNAASGYVLEKYYDQSGVATLSGPTQANGSTYYFTVNYGTASLAAGAAWEYQTAMHLSSWGSTYSGTNDWWHTASALPTSYTDWTSIPAYLGGAKSWGDEPFSGPTNTPSSTPTRTGTPTFTPTGPTPTFTRTPTFTPTSITPTFTPTRTPPPGTHLDNPFVGAVVYRNPDYVASVNAAADAQGGTLGQQMRQVANYPTFIWLDSIDAVNGTNGYPRSLQGHMDAALAQGANAIELVVYDLPNRDCSALASNGELLIAQDGLNKYKTQYIDVIFNVISQAKYSNLRIIMVVESDSIPNLVTNMSFAKCSEAAQPTKETGVYAQAFQYAIGKLRSIPNTYAYIDVAHAAWLGWPANFDVFVPLIKAIFKGVPGGGNTLIDGFISNTANYNPVDEPYMDANTMINGQPVRSLSGWYDYNNYIDEGPYMAALYTAFTTGSDAFPTSIGMIVDTSRNGWGGANRPTGPSTSTDLKTFVMASRIDKRIHKGNWCNQDGAGIGARPTANPMAGIDAYVWVKPPGESDGSSSLIPTGPDNPGGKGFDRMCDPTYTGNSLNGNNLSGALPNAPVSGRWFQAQFVQLVQNAYPALTP